MTECVFDNIRNCVALTEKRCHNCSFRKTKHQVSECRAKARARINSLPESQRVHITLKYYGGRQV